MDQEITKEDIGAVLSGIMKSVNDELKTMKREDLEKFWFFRYVKDATKDDNLYRFHDMLDLYRRKCRQWEEMHHGCSCVVERVRDRYLMPKIKQFIADLESDR